MTVVRLKPETLKRLDKAFKMLLVENSDTAKKLAEEASWDFKVNAILDRLQEAVSRGG